VVGGENVADTAGGGRILLCMKRNWCAQNVVLSLYQMVIVGFVPTVVGVCVSCSPARNG